MGDPLLKSLGAQFYAPPQVNTQPYGTPKVTTPAGGQEYGTGAVKGAGSFDWKSLNNYDPQNVQNSNFLTLTTSGKYDFKSGAVTPVNGVDKQLESDTNLYNKTAQYLGATVDDPNAKYKTALVGQHLCESI